MHQMLYKKNISILGGVISHKGLELNLNVALELELWILFKILGLNCQSGLNHPSVKCRHLSTPVEL